MEPRDVGVGLMTALAETELCRISMFTHHPHRIHRDPAEEVFPDTGLVLTTAGSWELAATTGRGRVGVGRLVAATAGDAYACRHDTARPRDVTIDIALRADGLQRVLGTEDGQSWVDDRGRLFPRCLVDLDAAAAGILHQLGDELASDLPGRGMAIDALVSYLIVRAARAAPAGPGAPTVAAMERYRVVLGAPAFRRLWLGSTVSTLGDGMTRSRSSGSSTAARTIRLRSAGSCLPMERRCSSAAWPPAQ